MKRFLWALLAVALYASAAQAVVPPPPPLTSHLTSTTPSGPSRDFVWSDDMISIQCGWSGVNWDKPISRRDLFAASALARGLSGWTREDQARDAFRWADVMLKVADEPKEKESE